jgi:hypothetical protein
MRAAIRTIQPALLAVLFLVVTAMLVHCTLIHAQDKNVKKEPDPPKLNQNEVILKAIEETKLAVEGLKSQIVKLQAGLPQSTGTQKEGIKEIVKALEENRLAIEGLKSQIEKARAGPPQATGTQKDEIEEILKLSQETKALVESYKPSWIRDWVPVIASIIAGFMAVLTAGLSVYANYKIAVENQRANKEIAEKNLENAKDVAQQGTENAKAIAQQSTDMAKRGLQEKSREEERKRISEKIDGFYGPFLLLRKQSEYLYETFFMPLRSPKELEDYKDKEGKYRTVIALLKGHKFDGVDAWVLRQIIAIGKLCAGLIESQTGMIDDDQLRELLAKAKTHYWIIGELFEHPDHEIILSAEDDPATEAVKLKIHEKVQEEMKFPRNITDAVKKKQEALEQKLKELSQI